MKLAEQKYLKNIKQLENSKMELLQKIKYSNSEISRRDKQLIQNNMGIKFYNFNFLIAIIEDDSEDVEDC